MIVKEFCIFSLVFDDPFDILIDIQLMIQNLNCYFYVVDPGKSYVKVM